MSRLIRFFLLALAGLYSSAAVAQAAVGQCNDMSRGQAFLFYSNYYVHQVGNPMNAGLAARDPTFMTFLRAPAANPHMNAYFVGWNGSLIEITKDVGWQQIGWCQFHPGFVQQNPFVNIYQPPVMSQNVFVPTPAGNVAVPQQIANPERPFGVPMIATEARAQQCYQQSNGNQSSFADCMVRAMAGQRERAAYDCARSSKDKSSMALCMVGALGGEKERQIAQTLTNCQALFVVRSFGTASGVN